MTRMRLLGKHMFPMDYWDRKWNGNGSYTRTMEYTGVLLDDQGYRYESYWRVYYYGNSPIRKHSQWVLAREQRMGWALYAQLDKVRPLLSLRVKRKARGVRV